MRILLDLYGVLLDSERMSRGYRERVAEIVSRRFGGNPEAWKRAHDEAFLSYVRQVNEADWDTRRWSDVVDELDARNLLEMFEIVGVEARPEDALVFARQLEREAMASVDARFTDAGPAVDRLRRAGHRVYVATGGSETAEAALRGAGLRDRIDGLFTGHSQNAQKARAEYWEGIPEVLGVPAEDCVLVDDRLDYLEAAVSVGIGALLLDRKGAHRPEAMPAFVQATLRSLAGLPHWVETTAANRPP